MHHSWMSMFPPAEQPLLSENELNTLATLMLPGGHKTSAGAVPAFSAPANKAPENDEDELDPDVLCSNNLSIVKDGGYPKDTAAFTDKYTDVYFTITYSIDADGKPKYTTASHWNKAEQGTLFTIKSAPAYAWKNH
ncbi:hypothetical protein [Alteromonas lipolytica]|uniref:Uncharacterized protein n=1 Tax=Alteromonas lipolytica TaxID=1856405 RepID=A0A1E8FD75_9ALTE|nr:hypothetical protein [Alteromonas lipolytica]OFI33885.1 hypothetical protein BFC17_20175 [Alteromonas lipolytica]GGF67526.1 hypothetical protein GCM10011338_19630 [Alteromonas lipolytica]